MKSDKDSAALRSYRWDVLWRILAASVGAYMVVTAATVVVALCLPGPMQAAVDGATLLAYLAYPAVVMYVFASRSARHAWCWLAGCTLILLVLAALLRA